MVSALGVDGAASGTLTANCSPMATDTFTPHGCFDIGCFSAALMLGGASGIMLGINLASDGTKSNTHAHRSITLMLGILT